MPRKELDPRSPNENPPSAPSGGGGLVENQPSASVNPETPPTLEPVSVPGSSPTQEIGEKTVGMDVKPEVGESIPPPPPPAQSIQELDQTGHTDSAPSAETGPASASSMTSVTSMSEAAKVIEDLNLRRTSENGLESDVTERAA
jgi:hypothetical protein